MEIEDIKAAILDRADRSDPLNQIVVISARAVIDGVEHGWRAEVDNDPRFPDRQVLESAVAEPCKQILLKPSNPLIEGVLSNTKAA